MNMYLQIGLGLLPGTITALFLLLKRKAFNFKKVLISLLLLVCCGSMLLYGVSDILGNASERTQMPQEKMMAFVNALIQEGAYPEANETLDQYSKAYGYDDECRLAVARMALLNGNYENASYLYEYLCEKTDLITSDADEVVIANAEAKNDISDLMMFEYLLKIGENPEEYGYSEDVYETLKNTLEDKNIDIDIKGAVYDTIDTEYHISQDALDCAEVVSEVSQSYDVVGDGEENKPTNRYRRAFSEIEKNSGEYLSIDCVNKARLKAYVIAGDYDLITEGLSDDSDYHELMVAAELYMSGLVRKTDFPDNFQRVNTENVSATENRLDKIYNNMQDDLTVQDKKALRSRVQAVINQLDNPILLTIKEQLNDAAEEEAGTDGTKVNLELAKIENQFGNEASMDAYLSTAIYSSQDNEDDSYVAAMSQIISVIGNDENNELENIKNVSTYVDNVLDHSLTVDVEKIISPQYNPQENPDSNGDGYDNTVADSDGGNSFSQAASDYVSRAKSLLSIGRIDTERFEEITATVQIDSDNALNLDELKSELKLYDCGIEISDYAIKKKEYTNSNIMLLCDVSGSMSESMDDLITAVETFIADKNEYENLSIVTFDSNIVDSCPFGTSDNELRLFAENMLEGGGTDMFSALVDCLANYQVGQGKESNVLILMTDGQDNNPRTATEIYQEIGQKALEKGVTVHAVGLGYNVDTAYLSTIAESGNGEFVYVSDSSSLTSFYDMLHSQVYSQYEITYKAQDTTMMSGRTLELVLPSENARDVKTYSLVDDNDSDNNLQVSYDLSVSGISPRYLYKGFQDADVKLKGTGFKADSRVAVKLNGNIDYNINANYVDSETYSLAIPRSIAVGNYDVEVSIDGKNKIFQNGFSVLTQGDEKKTVFGPYVFTSSEKIENAPNDYTLRGSVVLNGWLHFKGDLDIVGDLNSDGSIRVLDHDGSFVEYNETATGIGKFLAKKGIPLSIPALNEFELYDDQEHLYDYANYMVEDIPTDAFEVSHLLRLDGNTFRLYPNGMGMSYDSGRTLLPYQDIIMALDESAENLFAFSLDGETQITDRNVGVVLDISYKDSQDEYNKAMNLFNSPVYINGNVKIKINTIKNEYTLGAMARFAFFAKESGFGAEVAWKGDLVPNSAKLSLNLKKAIKLKTTIPIEVNDFEFEVSDIDKSIEAKTWKSLKFTGSASLSSMKVKEYLPALEKFVGNISVFEMPNTTASIRVSPFTLEATAELRFLSDIKLAEAEVKMGNFDYTNNLLHLDGVNVDGFSASLKEGFMWESDNGNVSVEVSGTGELDAHSRFVGVDYVGTVDYDIKWWKINSGKALTGEAVLGLYTTHDEKNELVFAYRSQDSNGKVSGNFYYIDENGKCGKNSGVLN